MAELAAVDDHYSAKIFPIIINDLKSCEPKLLAKHIENIIVIVNNKNKEELIALVSSREPSLKDSQVKRIYKILQTIN